MKTPKKKRQYTDGKPSVTEIISKNLGWKSQALYGYFYKRGKDGLPMNEGRDSAASRGSCAHDLVAAHFAPEEHGDLSEWRTEQIAEAKPNANRVIAGIIQRKWTPLAVELPMEVDEFAGTVDMVVRDADGRVIIVDLKTSRGAYPETAIQIGAYQWLWHAECARRLAPAEQEEHTANDGVIIHAPYGGDLNFIPVTSSAMHAGEQVFRRLLDIHTLASNVKIGPT